GLRRLALGGRAAWRSLCIGGRLRARGVRRGRRPARILALLGGTLRAIALIAAGLFLRRGRALALLLNGLGSFLRFFLLGAGLAAGRIVAIHLRATLGAILGVLRVLAFARGLRIAAALAGILRAFVG